MESKTNTNINALNISPYLWWKFIDKANYLAGHHARELFDYDFKKWLEGNIVTERRVFDSETWNGFKSNPEKDLIRDYSKIGKKNSAGILISAKDEEELDQMTALPEKEPLVYSYSIASLHHLCFSFFNLWLVFNTDDYKYNWQAYFNFIYVNNEKKQADIYKYFWFWVLLEIDKQGEFEQVNHYRQFVRILHEYEKETAYLEELWIAKRDGQEKNKG